jgi:hypothetical protein
MAKSTSLSETVIEKLSYLDQLETFGLISGKTSKVAEYTIGLVASSESRVMDGGEAGLKLFSVNAKG